MSILKLQKATLIGLTEHKAQLLDQLQTLGVLHIIPLSSKKMRESHRPQEADVSPEYLSTLLAYLLSCSHKRRQVLSERHFKLDTILAEVSENRNRRLALLERRDFLKKRIKDLRPWGSFILPEHGELYEHKLWFYLVPNYKMRELSDVPLPWSAVHRDNRHTYVAVVSPKEPPANLMPVQRTHTGSVPMDMLERELEDVEILLETLEAEREALTRWIYLLQRSVAGIADQDSLKSVADQTMDRQEIFAIQGWVAERDAKLLEGFAMEQGMVLQLLQPETNELPPTYLDNPNSVAGGEEVVHFFQMPGYRGWDPSRVVFFSFVTFFALIMSDAGYSLLLGGILAFYWKRMGTTQSLRRLRVMGVALTLAGAVWGVLVGSYFGAPPPSWLAPAKIMDLNDFDSMMMLSISIGAGHLILGNLMMAWVRRKERTRWGPLGWAIAIASILWGWLSGFTIIHWLGAGLGLVMVFLFTAETSGWGLKRLLSGLLALTNVTKLFGDVLSYLRLFALGLASASLAVTFNQLAVDVAVALPGIGLLLKVLILLTGHLLNFVLTVISGVIHGLRLNLIEFYNWSLADEGYAFQPFAKREVLPWIT